MPESQAATFPQAAEPGPQDEHKLSDSEAHYRTLFDTIDEGFCVVEFICSTGWNRAVKSEWKRVKKYPNHDCMTSRMMANRSIRLMKPDNV